MIRNRLTQLLGIDYPIVQAPMGWIARARLAAAVSNAGGMGIIATSAGGLETLREEIRETRRLTTKPFGVNVAGAFVRDPDIVQMIVDEGVTFATTSAGDPNRYAPVLMKAGMTVFHVVPSLAAAVKAAEAGVHGLVVEGGEGGGFKNARDVSTMVLLPLVCAKIGLPVIAAGGITDGRSMAATFALGAQGVQLGTRMVASEESPVHDNWKQAILAARETDTLFLNRHGPGPALRALRTERASRYELEPPPSILDDFRDPLDLYYGGDMEAGIALCGQVAGRIDTIQPVADILRDMVAEFQQTLGELGRTYGNGSPE